MNTPRGETFRLMFVVRKNELSILHEVISSWRDAFSEWGRNAPDVCVWVTGQEISDVAIPRVCLHTLELPVSIDHYARSPLERKPWSPWGLKSGPNFQFFEILRRMHHLHAVDWVLQLETDTVPLRKVLAEDLPWLAPDSEEWVVGASAEHASPGSLSSSTKNHINGAAFYRVGSEEFMSFVTHTWAGSLLFIASIRPALAYDSLTSPGVWAELPPALSNEWERTRFRFASDANMVNLSNRETLFEESQKQLEAHRGSRHDHDNPWFLHRAKMAR